MTKSFFKTLGIFCVFTMLLTSCSEEIIQTPQVIAEEKSPSTDAAPLSLYVVETDELITVNSIDEIKDIIQTKYSHLDYAQASIDKLNAYQEEAAYAESLDLDDPAVELEYSNSLKEKYGEVATERAGNGILYDGQASGFLSFTNVPWNLKKSKRDRASSWVGIIGTTVLCEKTW